MLKKGFLGFLSILLFFTLVSPLTSQASTLQTSQVAPQTTTSVSGMGNQYSEEESLAIMEAISLMDQYIHQEGEKLVLDTAAKAVVEPFVFAHFETGVAKINAEVAAGSLSLDTANESIKVDPVLTSQLSQGDYEAPLKMKDDGPQYSYTNKYWWGVKWYLSKKEATYWQNRFSDYAFGWSVIAAIAGVVGAPVASIAAIIMAAGNYYFYRELRDNTSSRGSVLVFKWAPPSAYAYKR
jgi:hypothetical protein